MKIRKTEEASHMPDGWIEDGSGVRLERHIVWHLDEIGEREVKEYVYIATKSYIRNGEVMSAMSIREGYESPLNRKGIKYLMKELVSDINNKLKYMEDYLDGRAKEEDKQLDAGTAGTGEGSGIGGSEEHGPVGG